MVSSRPVSLRHPRSYDLVDDPIEIAGIGTGFEGTLQVRVRDAAGDELVSKHFSAGGTGIWGNFLLRVNVPGVPSDPHGTLEVFELSAEDGSEINKVVRRIVFGRALRDPFTGFSIHEVRPGDTLSAIAREVYGDTGDFRVIFEANRDQLSDPDVILPGQLLRIPQ